MEWQVIKAFSAKYKIRQKDLIIVFNSYLTHDEIFVRQFRVRTKDARDRYNGHSKLLRVSPPFHTSISPYRSDNTYFCITQELAEILIPSIYLKPFTGLEDMENPEEVTFSRFAITSYIFVMSQIPDLMYDFMAILRRRLDIPITVVVSAYAYSHLVKLLMEDLKHSGSAAVIRKYVQSIAEGPDLRLKMIIRLATKYPLVFFGVQKFRILYKRYVYGDRFWKGRKPLKCKHLELLDYPADFNEWFNTEADAVKATARNIIGDVLRTEINVWTMTDIYYPPYERLTEEHGTRLKAVLGYKSAMKIMIESQIPYDFDPVFARPYIEANGLKKVVPIDVEPETLEEGHKQKIDEEGEEGEEDGDERDHEKPEEDEEEKDIEENDEDRAQSPSRHEKDRQDTDEVMNQGEQYDEDGKEGVIHLDETFNREFLYDVYTGRSRWAKIIMNANGDTLHYEFE